MINKKMAAGILLAGAIALSGTISLAEVNKGQCCPQDKDGYKTKAPADPAKFQAKVKDALDSLVKDGTLSSEQRNAVLKAFEAKRAQFEKEHQKLKNEGKLNDENFRQKHGLHDNKHGVLKDLVDDGIITKEQADAIRKAIRPVHENTKNQDK